MRFTVFQTWPFGSLPPQKNVANKWRSWGTPPKTTPLKQRSKTSIVGSNMREVGRCLGSSWILCCLQADSRGWSFWSQEQSSSSSCGHGSSGSTQVSKLIRGREWKDVETSQVNFSYLCCGEELVEDSLVGYIYIYTYIFTLLWLYMHNVCIYVIYTVYIIYTQYYARYLTLYIVRIYCFSSEESQIIKKQRLNGWIDYTCSYLLLVTTIHVTLWQHHLQRSTCVGQGWTRRFVWHTKRPWSTGPLEDDIASRQSTRQRRKRRRWWQNGNT